MSAKANTAKIGLFIILAVVLLVAGLLAFGARTYFVSKTNLETAIYGEVYGLSAGSGVQLRGVPIGKVTQITFAWNLYPDSKVNVVVVEFQVEGDLLPLPPGKDMKAAVKQADEQGLRAMVKSQGITGTSILALEPLDPKTYPPPAIDYTPRHLYIPSAPPQLERLLESLDQSLKHLQDVDFASISQSVTNTLVSARHLVDKLGEVDFKSLSTNANSLIVDLKGTSAKLTATLDEVQKTIANAKLDRVSTNADELLTGLRASNEKLQTVLDHLGNVPLQQTAASLQQTLQNLDQVLVELKEYPSGFIFGQPPQPVEGMKAERQ